MKLASSILALATLAVILPADAQKARKEGAAEIGPGEAVNSPLKVIYRISGVADDGSSGVGVATSFHCTNFGNVNEKVKFTVRTFDGDTSKVALVRAGETITASTKETDLFFENVFLNTGFVEQGGAIIAATATQTIFCSAMLVDPNDNDAEGIALHMVRFNPAPRTQE